jgi:FKBP-type peptidyl-prolyl cis-trans isomerase
MAELEELEFAPSLGVDLDEMTRTREGVYYEGLAPGSGEEATVNSAVSIHYLGWLPDGELFDSSLARGEPMEFTLGFREVIPGWEEGIRGMREGGRRLLVIPPDLAYGDQGVRGAVPPNATLVFEIQLVEVR